MVLEDGADSKHQRKSVTVWWGESGTGEGWVRETKGGKSSITSPHGAVQENKTTKTQKSTDATL